MEKAAIDFLLFQYSWKRIKMITKKTSIKNLYWAEKLSIKILFINKEIQIRVISLFFFIKANTEKMNKLRMKRILIFDLIPFRRNQFFI